jgi:hypothetical protein
MKRDPENILASISYVSQPHLPMKRTNITQSSACTNENVQLLVDTVPNVIYIFVRHIHFPPTAFWKFLTQKGIISFKLLSDINRPNLNRNSGIKRQKISYV